MPELPALDSGLQLLEADTDPIGALHSLVLDHLLLNSGQAYWVDTGSWIAPHHLARVAPNLRVLDCVQVARGFTPYQHYALAQQFTNHVTSSFANEDAATDSEVDDGRNRTTLPYRWWSCPRWMVSIERSPIAEVVIAKATRCSCTRWLRSDGSRIDTISPCLCYSRTVTSSPRQSSERRRGQYATRDVRMSRRGGC